MMQVREMQTALGVDIGGTNLTVALVRSDGALLNIAREDTPRCGPAALEVVLEMVDEVQNTTSALASPPVGLGVGFGGPVDFGRQRIITSHQVTGWAPDWALGEAFAARFAGPVVIDNDANCGGLGEARFGAGRGCSSLLYVNIGTGIGGAVLLNGEVYHGAHSMAGEIGHCVLAPGGPVCTCGKQGCLEALSSGRALARAGREAGLGREITGKEVGLRAAAGEARARQVVARAGHWLGVGLGNAANLLNPEIIVLGGGVAQIGELYLEAARESFAATVMPAADCTALVVAQLGYEAGVTGAAALVL